MTRHLITSALPYINGVKHLGNLVGSLLPADVYARFLRRRGEPVLFICATDEHGAPAELAAAEQGMDVAAYCLKLHGIQADLCARFGIAFDHFGRSSSAENRELTQHLYRRLDDQGFIEERNLRQVYSVTDGRFLADRYVVGTCPRCGYDGARGDQCENCTSLLDATELIRPRSVISGSTDLEVRESRHLFLRLPLLADRVKAWVDAHPDWPLLTKSIALGWLKEGLHDRGITRDLTWGVPVPRPGFEGKVFYVWFDAPVEYIGATKEHFATLGNADEYLRWWRDANDVTYTQFMAKDNVPFHTVMWPAVLLGTDEGWKQVDYIKAFNWLTYYGGKFSTSNHRGVFMDQALDLLPADYWRYALLAHAPETDDASFTWPQFQSTCNKDLADTFGNFVSRVLKLTASKFGPAVPAGGVDGPAEVQLRDDCAALMAAYAGHLSRSEFGKAIGTLRAIWTLGNVYIDGRAPWSLVKTDRDAAAVVMRTCINLIRIYAVAAWPVIPFAAERVYGWLHLSDAERQPDADDGCNLDVLAPGRPFEIPDLLFRKIDDAEVKAWEQQFGTQG